MLIAEDLLLLLTDDQTGKLLVASNQADLALGGAILIELAIAKQVDVASDTGAERRRRLTLTDTSPTSDALLDEALAYLAEKQGKRPKDLVAALGKGLRARLQTRLGEQGILHQQSGKIFHRPDPPLAEQRRSA